ncbi:MAG: glutaredoxin family protein [Azoarcus sp.]|nr:glutaredoxin family protein [Azoarcus sp.]
MAQQYGWRIKEIDIDQAPELEAQWDEQIPVLLADCVEICRHRLNTDAVHAFCQANASARPQKAGSPAHTPCSPRR